MLSPSISLGIFQAVHWAGVAALTGDQAYLDGMRDRFQRRRDIFVDGLNAIGFSIPKPKATFYIWAWIPGRATSKEFARGLLEKTGVVATPGAGFGTYGEGYFRAAMTVEESRLEEAVARMGRFMG